MPPRPAQHEPINGFNSDEVSSYLNQGYKTATNDASQGSSSTVVYKPTSGSWTTTKSNYVNSLTAKTSSLTNDILKALKDGGKTGGQNSQKARKHSR